MIEIALKLIFFRKIAKITQRLGALPTGPLCDTLELHQFVQHGSELDNCCAKKKQLLVQAPSLLVKPSRASGRIHSCRQIFQAIIWAAYETI